MQEEKQRVIAHGRQAGFPVFGLLAIAAQETATDQMNEERFGSLMRVDESGTVAARGSAKNGRARLDTIDVAFAVNAQ